MTFKISLRSNFCPKTPTSPYPHHFCMPALLFPCLRAVSSQQSQIRLPVWQDRNAREVAPFGRSRPPIILGTWYINTPALLPSGRRTLKHALYTVSTEFPSEINYNSNNMAIYLITHPVLVAFLSLSHFPPPHQCFLHPSKKLFVPESLSQHLLGELKLRQNPTNQTLW